MLTIKKCLVCGNADPNSITEVETGYECEHCGSHEIEIEVVDNDEAVN